MTLSLAGPLLLVGAGKMGGAMLEGWLRQGLDPATVVHPGPRAAARGGGARRASCALPPARRPICRRRPR